MKALLASAIVIFVVGIYWTIQVINTPGDQPLEAVGSGILFGAGVSFIGIAIGEIRNRR